jgi:hypothetical protein
MPRRGRDVEARIRDLAGEGAGLAAVLPGGGVLLALDVSSSACGFAFNRPGCPEALEFGVILPRPDDAPAPERIDQIVGGVRTVVEAARPARVVMEWSSGKIHGRLRKAASLSVLGAAQGAVRQSLRQAGLAVDLVAENDWTGSRPKPERARAVRALYPAYDRFAARGDDRGLDAADAIGLLDYWWPRVTMIPSEVTR